MGGVLGAAGGKSFHVDNDYRWWDLWGGVRTQINTSTVAGERSPIRPGWVVGARDGEGRSNPQLGPGASEPFSPPSHPGQRSQRLEGKVEDPSSSATGGQPGTAAVTDTAGCGREGTLRGWGRGHLEQTIPIKVCPWKLNAVKGAALGVLSSRELKNYSKKGSRTQPSPSQNQAPHSPCYTAGKDTHSRAVPKGCSDKKGFLYQLQSKPFSPHQQPLFVDYAHAAPSSHYIITVLGISVNIQTGLVMTRN